MIISEQVFNNTISLNPNDLNKDINNITLLKLKKQFEGLCKDDCYILKNSIVILNKSDVLEKQNHLNSRSCVPLVWRADRS